MKRENLILDIISFKERGILYYNQEGLVNRADYFQIISRVFSIQENDFETKEKYLYFLKFINNIQRRIDRNIIENGFDGDFLHSSNFLRMCNYLEGIKEWLKK